jgi:biotin carboxylase
MSQDGVLLLTAGYWQIPVVRCAKALGLRVVVTDLRPQAPAVAEADAYEQLDSSDVEAVTGAARKHGVAAILAEQTDVAVATAAAAAERCNLRGIGLETSLRVTNKRLMRDACAAAGVPVPLYRCVQDARQAVDAARDIGLPVVVKPTDSQASKGVAKVWNLADVPMWFAYAVNESRERKVLVEQMLCGVESSVEAYVTPEAVTVLGISEKTKSPPPFSFDTRLVYPATFAPQIMDELRRVNERVVRAVGIPFGISHAEYMVTPQGVYLLEVAARGCGAGVASTLVPAMTGFDPIRARLLDALGRRQPAPVLSKHECGLLEFLMLPPGEVLEISGLEEARSLPGVLAVDYFVRPGDRVADIRNGAERPGYCLAVGGSYAELDRTLAEVKSRLTVGMR